ncbi:MAG TPA: hypothetical protein VMF31_12350 [Solirubrobacterales bacterium]|nr:hypothetical protein [Solirubrobacterales bacterium]
MPFKVLSWNVQRLSPLSERRPGVERVIERNKPDLLFLSEISHDLVVPGYIEIGHALSLNKSKVMGKGAGTHGQLNTKLYMREDSTLEIHGVKTIRQGAGQPRLMLRAVVEDAGRTHTLDFIHSKATKKGGVAAMKKAKASAIKFKNHSVFGDFNHDISIKDHLAEAAAGGAKVVPVLDTAGKVAAETHKSSKSSASFDYALTGEDVEMEALRPRVDTRAVPKVDARLGVKTGYKLRRVPPRFVTLSDHRPAFVRIK